MIASKRAALVIAAMLTVSPASGQTSAADASMAQSLFDRARDLMEKGSFGEACPLFEESNRLDPAGGTLLNLALCREKEGKIATAYARFHEALSVALREGRADRQKLAQERIDALSSHLSKITIQVPAEAAVPGLTIELDRRPVPKAAWGTPTAVDGGLHRIVASAPTRQSWVTTLDVGPTDDMRQVKVPVLPPMTLVPYAPPSPSTWTLPLTCPPGRMLSGGRCIDATESKFSRSSWVVGGISLGAVVLGAATGIAALVSQSDADASLVQADCLPEREFCRDATAAEDANSARGRAEVLAWISTISFGVGAGGFLLALVLPRDKVPRRAQVTVGAAPLPSGGSLSITLRP